jgi:hypothetical protein
MDNTNPLDIIKRLDVKQNVTIRVIDEATNKVVQEHVGHNAATNSLLTGIAHYLLGDGVLNQSQDTLSMWVPQYISVGTMGLTSQDAEDYLPVGIGYTPIAPANATAQEKELNARLRYSEYINQAPGFGADGYDAYSNNDREWFGLGQPYKDKPAKLSQDFFTAGDQYILTGVPITGDKDSIISVTVYPDGVVNQDIENTSVVRQVLSVNEYSLGYNDNNQYELTITATMTEGSRIAVIYAVDGTDAINCELIAEDVARSQITYRRIIPEVESEIPNTLDVIYSAMISTGALAQFRGRHFNDLTQQWEYDRDYVYITEAGLWSKPYYNNSGDNGLLAGYRIMPTDDQVDILGAETIFTATGESTYELDAVILSIDSITCNETSQIEQGDGDTTSFKLLRTADIITSVKIDNVETSDYTIDGSNIVFATAPADESSIVINYTNLNVIPDAAYSFKATSEKTTIVFSNGYIPTKDAEVLIIYRSGDNAGTWKDMTNPENREAVQKNIIRIGTNQVAQIIWKIQLGGLEQLNGLRYLYPSQYPEEVWNLWTT